jgi:hypothetical protein
MRSTVETLEALRATLFSQMDAHEERMMVCLGKTEATDLYANPEENESVAELQEVRISGIGTGMWPKSEAASQRNEPRGNWSQPT